MAGNSAAALTAKPNGGGGAAGHIEARPVVALTPCGTHRQLDDLAVPKTIMTTLLTTGLAIAALVGPLACAYAIVVRLARRRSRSH
jgi:hypothetical protein